MFGFECVWKFCVVSFTLLIMENYSLEDDDFGDMFITQSSNDNGGDSLLMEMEESGNFLGIDRFDFQSPCSTLLRSESDVAHYSDISDFEDDCGSNLNKSQDKRYVNIIKKLFLIGILINLLVYYFIYVGFFVISVKQLV